MGYTLTREEEKFWLSLPDEPELPKNVEVVPVSEEERQAIIADIRQSIMSL